ncbi:hypothetical protein [Nakamurella lactea]|uniref:hypothetical protein n=1 Tax=Nakamurella lactea TaxID=459515 RepID=UPI0003FFDCCB|nr:hypothetical protein [Nakamurella lactea]
MPGSLGSVFEAFRQIVEPTGSHGARCSRQIVVGGIRYRVLAIEVATLLSCGAIEVSGAGHASRIPWHNIGPAQT